MTILAVVIVKMKISSNKIIYKYKNYKKIIMMVEEEDKKTLFQINSKKNNKYNKIKISSRTKNRL